MGNNKEWVITEVCECPWCDEIAEDDEVLCTACLSRADCTPSNHDWLQLTGRDRKAIRQALLGAMRLTVPHEGRWEHLKSLLEYL